MGGREVQRAVWLLAEGDLAMKNVAIVFCKCGSSLVDVWGQTGSGVRFTCASCRTSTVVDGFTLGRTQVDEPTFNAAQVDVPRRR